MSAATGAVVTAASMSFAEEIRQSYENAKTVAQFIKDPGPFIAAWGRAGLSWTVLNSYEICVIIALFGLILKMMSIDKGVKVVQGSLAAYVIIQMLGVMFL